MPVCAKSAVQSRVKVVYSAWYHTEVTYDQSPTKKRDQGQSGSVTLGGFAAWPGLQFQFSMSYEMKFKAAIRGHHVHKVT